MKKELKGFICGVAVTTTLICGGAFAAGQWKTIDVLENDITVIVDGKQVTESNFVYNDRTYLPLRAVADAVGKPVEYDAATNTAYIGTTYDKPSTSFPIQYDKVHLLENEYGRISQINSFEITSLEETNIGNLRIAYEIVGQTNDDFLSVELNCFDADGFLLDSIQVLAEDVSPFETFKFRKSSYIPADTAKIELSD